MMIRMKLAGVGSLGALLHIRISESGGTFRRLRRRIPSKKVSTQYRRHIGTSTITIRNSTTLSTATKEFGKRETVPKISHLEVIG